ncbi:MAG: flagellin [Paracoccaceae bacterium]
MTFLSIGDLSVSYQNRRQNFELKTTLQRLSQELVSGQRADIATIITGDFTPIATLERSLKTTLAYTTVTAEATLLAASMQTALEHIQNTSSELATSLLVAGTSADSLILNTTASDAKSKFGAALSALNVRVADRYAFSGVTTNTPAFADETTILDALQLVVSTETTAQGVKDILDSWFDDAGGGFETIAYTGSDTKLGSIKISSENTVDLSTTAADVAIREVLKGLAMATFMSEGTFSGTPKERTKLAIAAGEKLHSAQYDLTALRANLGSAEASIDNVTANNSAQTAALEIARIDLTVIDPYQVATQLENISTQLEVFYTVTARLSRMSLAEYLR